MKHYPLLLALVVLVSSLGCTTIDTENGPRTVMTPEGTEAIRALVNIGASVASGYAYNGSKGAQTGLISGLSGASGSALVGAFVPTAPRQYNSYPSNGYYPQQRAPARNQWTPDHSAATVERYYAMDQAYVR